MLLWFKDLTDVTEELQCLSEHTCLTNHAVGWDNSKIFTTNRRYHQRLCLEAWHINSAHAPLNRVVSLMTFMDRQ